MKNKGLYTGAIALIAVAIITVMSFGMVSTMQAQQQESNAGKILETKWQWQNAHDLSGKIVSDAIADSVFSSGCVFNPAGIADTIGNGGDERYLKETLSESLSICRAGNVSVNSPGPSLISASFDLECEVQAQGFSASYGKNGLNFDKQAFTYTDLLTGECFVDVLDLDTGKCEVDTIDDTVGIGC